jgi:hypothetical protein
MTRFVVAAVYSLNSKSKKQYDLNRFFAKYNQENTIILLRKTQCFEIDKEKLIQFGKFLATTF